MGTFAHILIIIGAVIVLVGYRLTTRAAFRESFVWGIGCIFLGPVQLIFTIVHWTEAKRGFYTTLTGTLIAVIGLVGSPDRHSLWSSVKPSEHEVASTDDDSAPRKPADALTAQIKEKRDRLEALEAQYAKEGDALSQLNKDLTARRSTLQPADQESIAKFNLEAAEYKARNTARPPAAAEIATARGEVEKLLDDRARLQARSAPPALAPSAVPAGKSVVMYTTATCPACQAAKAYFAQKGVRYQERDVVNSPEARGEFQKLGGTGVPLILVGNEKMEGFNPARLNQLL